MVRLKAVEFETAEDFVKWISIPYGAIKSCFLNCIVNITDTFQFLMVRLKANIVLCSTSFSK